MKTTVLSFMCQKIAPNETTFGLGLCSPVWYSMTAGGKLDAPYSGMVHNRCALAPPTIYPSLSTQVLIRCTRRDRSLKRISRPYLFSLILGRSLDSPLGSNR